MPTTALSNTPTTLDDGASESVWIRNLGTTVVTVTNGVQRSFIRPDRDLPLHVSGVVTASVLAQDGTTGSIYYDTSSTNPGSRLVTTSQLAPGLTIDGGTP